MVSADRPREGGAMGALSPRIVFRASGLRTASGIRRMGAPRGRDLYSASGRRPCAPRPPVGPPPGAPAVAKQCQGKGTSRARIRRAQRARESRLPRRRRRPHS
ncbi:MAG: hypothetical protein Kow0062_23620 [Acidobacteriota bacterium]